MQFLMNCSNGSIGQLRARISSFGRYQCISRRLLHRSPRRRLLPRRVADDGVGGADWEEIARHRPETASCATSGLPHSATSNTGPGRWLAVHGLQQQLVASRVEMDSSAVCSCWIRQVDRVMINSSSAACGA
jgi:hypothetical protein